MGKTTLSHIHTRTYHLSLRAIAFSYTTAEYGIDKIEERQRIYAFA